MAIRMQPYGMVDGQAVYEYTLTNKNGLEIACLNYGCAVRRVLTPDREGNYANVVLGFPELTHYRSNPVYCGVVVGRVAGRIKDACFELGGTTYRLDKNNGRHHLHGGVQGFSHAVWQAEMIDRDTVCGVRFFHVSPDGEGGYPGEVQTQITYTLNESNEFLIQYQAHSEAPTLFSPTNHMYFNLSGGLQRDILQHTLKIDSDRFLELDADLIPTGKILDVEGTAFDFRSGRSIHDGVISEHPQNQLVRGYDHAFLLNHHYAGEIELYDELSGRHLMVETDAPGVVLYTGNQLPDDLDFVGGRSRRYLGLCLETQGLPDAVHHSHFFSCILQRGAWFTSATKYSFNIMAAGSSKGRG
ncbi:hypothetical protein P22_1044 [Propionispora sp. 2/2-37]|uniref:aldose epimerase family protein n=1 Tax=Propionispora sp. 2/2-37 TaxID=1677858 RepID=UPI0006BB89D2|nr:aldose epimerase family protein [Propionispora sp. 2/2-37]CUH94975.1 hypothetical protein P22_1044 [Propionispora sp. 2/2-37]